jgi:hypothetical protein
VDLRTYSRLQSLRQDPMISTGALGLRSDTEHMTLAKSSKKSRLGVFTSSVCGESAGILKTLVDTLASYNKDSRGLLK